MVRERPSLGTPFGTDGPWLAAILDVLGDLHDLIDERLPRGEEPAKVTEPAPANAPAKAVPVSEPAPDVPPERAKPVAEPAPDPEPEPDDEDEAQVLPEPPPRAGRGSGLEAWQAWADLAKVEYDADAGRDDIIAACELAEVLPAK